MFIGVYNYTVILTYLSLISGWLGIYLSLEKGRLYAAMICLLVAGLCDAFDGRVARTKKDRTETEKGFGIQIDSLTDIVSFGVLPAALSVSCIQKSYLQNTVWQKVLLIIPSLYLLTALIRLAYFNVHEEERQKKEGSGAGKSYIGLPVTASSLIFPTILLVQFLSGIDLVWVFFIFMLATALAFIAQIQVKKPNLKGILIMVAIGAIELIIFIVRHWFIK